MNDLAAEHRRAVVAVADLAERDLRKVWGLAVGRDPTVTRDVMLQTVPTLAEIHGDRAAGLAADFYDEQRDRAQVPGRFRAEPAPLPGSARYEALVRWGVDPLFMPSPDQAAAIARIAAGFRRIVANQSRDTVVESSLRDPAAEGWQRIVRADGCSYCRMLADRGAVYKESTSRFAAHDNCNCSAAPAFSPRREVSVLRYQASSRRSSPADRARVRDYLKRHY
jgi:hypothetical protein